MTNKTGIRAAALALYQPPFKFTAGYVFDAGGKMVADDGKDDDAQLPLIAARIRGWGRIQYLDNPRGRAAALQDEVGAIVCEALNAYWASVCATCNGIGMVGGPSYYQPSAASARHACIAWRLLRQANHRRAIHGANRNALLRPA